MLKYLNKQRTLKNTTSNIFNLTQIPFESNLEIAT